MASIIVDVDADGNVKLEAQGVQGTGCTQLTRAIEQALGRTIADQKKPEYFQQQGQHVRANGHS